MSRESWKFGDVKANPPWTNHYFDCSHCGARYQLGCADELEFSYSTLCLTSYATPPCWTCGRVNTVIFSNDDVTLQHFNDSTERSS
jgi:hypothetical protein